MTKATINNYKIDIIALAMLIIVTVGVIYKIAVADTKQTKDIEANCSAITEVRRDYDKDIYRIQTDVTEIKDDVKQILLRTPPTD